MMKWCLKEKIHFDEDGFYLSVHSLNRMLFY